MVQIVNKASILDKCSPPQPLMSSYTQSLSSEVADSLDKSIYSSLTRKWCMYFVFCFVF